MCEVAAFSALGAALAWMMWTALEPTGPLSRDTTSAVEGSDNLEAIAVRFERSVTLLAGNGPTSPVEELAGIILHATRTGAGARGAAILSVNGAAQTSYQIGESVAPGVKLSAVATDHVEFDLSGRPARVAFASAASPTVALSREVRADAASTALPPLTNSASSQREGFELTSATDPALLAASGLKIGDIILKINGADASGAGLASYTAQLQAGGSLDVEFKRNGQVATTRIGRPPQ